jgi:hypothetical protein
LVENIPLLAGDGAIVASLGQRRGKKAMQVVCWQEYSSLTFDKVFNQRN